MNFLLSALLCIVLVELAIRLPFAEALGTIVRTSQRAIWVLSAKSVSDHWRELAMGAYARATLVSTLRLGWFIFGLMALIVLLLTAMHHVSEEISRFVLSWAGLAFVTNISCLYWFARRPNGRGRL